MVNAMQRRDIDELVDLVTDDYLVLGVPGGRADSRDAWLQQGREFFSAGTIHTWNIHDVAVKQIGDSVAICTYGWSESGEFAGAAFLMEGTATDVLTRRNGRWIHQSRHVGMAN